MTATAPGARAALAISSSSSDGDSVASAFLEGFCGERTVEAARRLTPARCGNTLWVAHPGTCTRERERTLDCLRQQSQVKPLATDGQSQALRSGSGRFPGATAKDVPPTVPFEAVNSGQMGVRAEGKIATLPARLGARNYCRDKPSLVRRARPMAAGQAGPTSSSARRRLCPRRAPRRRLSHGSCPTRGGPVRIRRRAAGSRHRCW